VHSIVWRTNLITVLQERSAAKKAGMPLESEEEFQVRYQQARDRALGYETICPLATELTMMVNEERNRALANAAPRQTRLLAPMTVQVRSVRARFLSTM
jgi:hypothetical protein